MKTLKRIQCLVLVTLFSAFTVSAQEKQVDKGQNLDEKLQKSELVLKDFVAMKETIPQQLLAKAEGIVVIPGMIKAGLGIGGHRGKGIAMTKKADGSWSDPVFVTLTGGSVGFQAGVQSIDLVMVFTKGSILTSLAKGEFTLGGDIGVAAGPIGRSSSATTDTRFESEVYSYSRSKGLFAGLTLNGSKMATDNEANKTFYQSDMSAAGIFEKEKSSDHAQVVSLKNTIKELM